MHRFLVHLSNFAVLQQRLINLFQYLDTAPQIRKIFQWICKNRTWYYVLKAREFRLRGNDHNAFITLMMGQRCNKNDAKIHLGLSALYRDNCNVMAAHTHLKIANILKPGYSTIRLLAFESDNGLLTAGSKTMEKALNLAESIIYNHVTILNRVSIFYPEHADKLDLIRLNIKKNTESITSSSPLVVSRAVNLAIANRLLNNAHTLSVKSKAEIHPKTLKLLNRLTNDLGQYQHLLELCWPNETSANLKAFYKNQSISLKEINCQNYKIVELFIPAVFFSHPDSEKPTFNTVRKIFLSIIDCLLEIPNLVIIPRFQLYWNQCIPKTKDCYIISYHTKARDNPRHLHIQESPLAGRCSFDSSGFAGYSSIVADHSVIKNFTNGITDQLLKQHQEEMYKTYVSTNISKYFQPLSDEILSFPYVFVVLQIPTDIVSQLAYIPGIEMLKIVVDHYRGTETKVLVKRHPFCRSMGISKFLDELEAREDIIRTNNSIHSIIKSANLIITVNSGVGLEALIQGKKVVVTGACDYAYAAITVKSSKELEDALSIFPIPNDRLIQQFLYFYFYYFTTYFNDRKKICDQLKRLISV
jgi:Capsule polysaccharide biosynthesis protein